MAATNTATFRVVPADMDKMVGADFEKGPLAMKAVSESNIPVAVR
jgi:hypothetical protein